MKDYEPSDELQFLMELSIEPVAAKQGLLSPSAQSSEATRHAIPEIPDLRRDELRIRIGLGGSRPPSCPEGAAGRGAVGGRG